MNEYKSENLDLLESNLQGSPAPRLPAVTGNPSLHLRATINCNQAHHTRRWIQ